MTNEPNRWAHVHRTTRTHGSQNNSFLHIIKTRRSLAIIERSVPKLMDQDAETCLAGISKERRGKFNDGFMHEVKLACKNPKPMRGNNLEAQRGNNGY